jgi:IMP dehydrogenase
MKVNSEIAYTFDDVLLVPQHSDVVSRKTINLNARITKYKSIDIPIVAANMDTITGYKMMQAMDDLGGIAVLHRFMSHTNAFKEILKFLGDDFDNKYFAFSIGVNEDYSGLLDSIYDAKICSNAIVFIDIAHGDCDRVVKLIKHIRKSYKKQYDIVAGNVATPKATKRLIKAGATGIKVGIGPGSMCTTRLITGHGIPQLTAISECSEIAKKYHVPVIADGGIRHSGDIVKALAAGASSVMIGSLFAGCDETPGDTIRVMGKRVKQYRGMASRDAMMGWKNDSNTTPEGESMTVNKKGSVEKVVNGLLGGIKSGISYSGSHNIIELQKNAEFRVVTSSTIIENKAHGKDKL